MPSKKSNYSKKLLKKIWTLRVIDAIILVVPLIVFFIFGMMNDQAVVVEKVTLACSAMVALILVGINILAKTHLRSAIWILVIGLYVAVDNLMPLIITIAVATVADEFVITPTLKRLNIKYQASRTMDDRGIE